MSSSSLERVRHDAREQIGRLFCVIESRHFPAMLEVELSMAQVKGLFALEQHGPLTVGGLAECLHIGQPAASILVDRLVHLGTVERSEDPEDRRRTLVRLAAAGEDTVKRLRGYRMALLERWLDRLTEEDLRALAQGLAALSTAAEGDTGGIPTPAPVPDGAPAASAS